MPDTPTRRPERKTVSEWRREHWRQILLRAIQDRDEYAAANCLVGCPEGAIRERLPVGQSLRSMPQLRREISKALDAAIDELNQLRASTGL